MPEYLTTREVAELLRIKERKVYDLASSGALACSRAMGKLLFPEDAVHAWLARHEQQSATSVLTDRPNVFLGSHDPLLEWALRESECGLATLFDGSSDGLHRFAQAEGIATGLHIRSQDGEDWNVSAVRSACGAAPVVLLEWATRHRGLILGHEVVEEVKSLADIGRLRVVPRQASAGAQRLLLDLLAQAGQDLASVRFAEAARTEVDAAMALLEGKGDIAFGLASVAASHGLRFVPVMRERFDLLIDRKAWFEPSLQVFWRFCRSDKFMSRAAELEGYDVAGLGKVHFNGP